MHVRTLPCFHAAGQDFVPSKALIRMLMLFVGIVADEFSTLQDIAILGVLMPLALLQRADL